MIRGSSEKRAAIRTANVIKEKVEIRTEIVQRIIILCQTNCALFARSSFYIPSRYTETDQHQHVDHEVPGLLKSTCDIAANRLDQTGQHWANQIRIRLHN